jgi:hypothetical protein
MPNDYYGVLIDGSIVITSSTDTPPVSTTRDAATGAVVIDLKKTPAKGICAVLNLPSKPTTYADTLTVTIEESDVLAEPTGLKTWQAVAAFPIINAMLMVMEATATTAFVGSDVGNVLVATTDSGAATGVIVWYDPALETIGGKGKIIIAMADSGDDYSTAGDTLTSAGTGVATQGAAAIVYPQGGGIPGSFVVRFTATKRYVRANMTASAGGSFGLVSCYLQDNAEFPGTVTHQ